MEDNEIIELYWNRNERAILETDKKYRKYCNSIAHNILQNNEDEIECINDTYYKTWNSIPTARPNIFKLFLGKITRQLAINKYEKARAKKRYSGLELVLDELEECIPSNQNIEKEIEFEELTQFINDFLDSISDKNRKIFIDRYWYMYSIKEISKNNNIKDNNTKVILHRTRKDLKEYLEKRGVSI